MGGIDRSDLDGEACHAGKVWSQMLLEIDTISGAKVGLD